MLNKLLAFIRHYRLTESGDCVICALSGGADSVAMTYGLYLLRERLNIRLCAAHYNHHLRGGESDGDEAFVREFCSRWELPLYVGGSQVLPGEKGLEAAARDARYAYFDTLPGKIATAHTADDNAETLLLHMVRGTGLKGLGGIAPQRGKLVRPMLSVTRQEVLEFLQEWSLPYREDSSNAGDAFLRNRLRHQVMPLLTAENPRLSQNLSAMALRLRLDEEALNAMTPKGDSLSVSRLQTLHPALRYRCLEQFLRRCGVKEPEADHIALTERLVFSDKPSARANLPGGITVARNYDRLEPLDTQARLSPIMLPCPGSVCVPELALTVTCEACTEPVLTADAFTVAPDGPIYLRSRQSGDALRLSGGTKSLKKLFIDRKIPAHLRSRIPVLADSTGVLGVWGIGANLDRIGPGVKITFQRTDRQSAEK